MSIELRCCTEVLLQEIQDDEFSKEEVALTYAMAICSSETKDWKAINDAIKKRWSASAIERIKRMAWKRIEAKA
jgi:hypothetical protein